MRGSSSTRVCRQEREELLRALQEEEKEKHLLHDRIKELEVRPGASEGRRTHWHPLRPGCLVVVQAVVERQEVEKRAMEARAQRKFHETQHVSGCHTQQPGLRSWRRTTPKPAWASTATLTDAYLELLMRLREA